MINPINARFAGGPLGGQVKTLPELVYRYEVEQLDLPSGLREGIAGSKATARPAVTKGIYVNVTQDDNGFYLFQFQGTA